MKATKKTLMLALAAAGALLCGAALADGHGRFGFGINIGIPLWGPGYYSPGPYGYYPYQPMMAPYAPAYVQQAPQYAPPQAMPQASAGAWFYCAESKSFYPYVRECPGGWQRVSPTPPDAH
jgi:hypothetical protein